jgi:hypothetical protein
VEDRVGRRRSRSFSFDPGDDPADKRRRVLEADLRLRQQLALAEEAVELGGSLTVEPQPDSREAGVEEEDGPYCVCEGPGTGFMVCCSTCEVRLRCTWTSSQALVILTNTLLLLVVHPLQRWYHGVCMGIPRASVGDISDFNCPACTATGSPTLERPVMVPRALRSVALSDRRVPLVDKRDGTILEGMAAPTVRTLVAHLASHRHHAVYLDEEDDDSEPDDRQSRGIIGHKRVAHGTLKDVPPLKAARVEQSMVSFASPALVRGWVGGYE